MYGISFDDVVSQRKFHEAQKLGFALLSDPDGSVAAKYGVRMAKRAFAQRVTFVIDDEGILRKIDTKVDVSNHGTDLIDLLEDLQD